MEPIVCHLQKLVEVGLQKLLYTLFLINATLF
jgi:hypothetical protein